MQNSEDCNLLLVGLSYFIYLFDYGIFLLKDLFVSRLFLMQFITFSFIQEQFIGCE